MKAKALFAGALAVAALGGATTGATLNTQPLEAEVDPLASIPDHEIDYPSQAEIDAMKAPHNHYALETPQGRVEVTELAYHGRLRDEHEAHLAWEAAREREAEYLAAQYEQAQDAAPVPRRIAQAAPQAPTLTQPEPTTPMPQPIDAATAPVEPLWENGDAKVIDVQAELAAQS